MSEVKTAKVTGILQCKPWNGPKGTVYFHKIELDNGEVGEIGKKAENAFKIGDSVTYTSEQTEYGLKFKAVQENNGFRGGNGGGSRGSSASFALSYSKDLMCSMVAAGKTADLKAAEIADATMVVAAKFTNWLKEHE
jgi:hypothetical protein